MCRLAVFALAAASVLTTAGPASAQAPDARCKSLASLKLEHAQVTSAELADASAATLPAKLPAAVRAKLPPFCRVKIEDHPSADSSIQTEVWLPLTDRKSVV